MNTTEVLALIGALAWLPQILQWIFTALKRPKIHLVSLQTLQIGYEFNGPVIGITASISTQQKDALITQILLRAIHERGETRLFKWVWLNETQIRMRTVSGETAEFSKNHPAIALQVSTLTPAEKFITFRDVQYAAKYEQLVRAVAEQHNFLKVHEQQPLETLLKSKELSRFREFYLSNMYWKEGSYTFEVMLYEAHTRSVHTERLSLHLDQADIEALNKNCALFEKGLREFAAKQDTVQQSDVDELSYIYPKVKSVKHTPDTLV